MALHRMVGFGVSNPMAQATAESEEARPYRSEYDD